MEDYMKLIVILLISLVFQFEADRILESNRNKIDKTIAKEWDTGPYHLERIIPADTSNSQDERTFYRVNDPGDQLAGYLILASSKGRYDYFDYMILASRAGMVEKVEILVYRSDHGSEICSKSWLKQFTGNSGEPLEYGKDIDALSGATFSASSLTGDIPAVMAELRLLVGLGDIPEAKQE